ncbi:hypothetical protein KUTeg_010569 [Tegillarca granosa]|uniref:Uncharacterized protein n=1 Tax=Tegillarca granosa TaxID=220873 RepID=A0ABQ9F3F9_TEGGR|nr:hypothetical protein KUTeg_010569 [Tegillarca granosa]
MAKARLIVGLNSDSSDGSEPEFDTNQISDTINRVHVRQSPYIDTFCAHHSVRLTIDSGANRKYDSCIQQQLN